MDHLPGKAPSVAMLPWGDVIEDYLDDIGVSLQMFCEEMTGGWLFGYIDALRLVGMRTVVFCFSSQLNKPVRWKNRPTGATFCVLPASLLYLKLRSGMRDPYGWTPAGMFDEAVDTRSWYRRGLRAVLPYLATPIWPLARALRHESCDILLSQEYESPRFDACVVLGKILGLPIFATFQGGTWQRSRMERYLRPLSLKACDGLVIAPQTEIDRVQRVYDVPSTRIARIFNPLDLSLWFPDRDLSTRDHLGIPASAQVAVWHGRVDIHRKGLDVLLEAWQKVYKERPNQTLQLLLIGTGADEEDLRRRISEMDGHGVIWMDRYILDREEMRRYLSIADLYVFPSRHEGFPVAPLEAMACGLPIVAAAAPGIPDILGKGDSSGGLIVSCGDAAALAQAMGTLLDDPNRRRAMGMQARSRVERAFTPETVGVQLGAFFAQNAPDAYWSSMIPQPTSGPESPEG